MTTQAPCTLITGASGLIGGQWLRTLLSRGGERKFLLLTRRPELFAGMERVTAVPCDLANGAIRIDDEWVPQVTEIIHCAADIRFGVSLEAARATNVEGTRRMLELARRCPQLAKFGHVSSVYASGKLEGNFPEQPFPSPSGFFNVYQQSKYEAEQLVLDALPGVPVAIFRLSSVIGNSRGEVQQFNYFHQLLKMIPNSGRVPVMPGNPAAPVDLIASDWAVAALDHLFEHCFEPGRIYHVCGGPAGALPVRRLVDVTFRKFGRRPARLVSMAEFERYAAGRNGAQGGVVSELWRVLDQFLPLLALHQSFENTRTAADLGAAGIYLPPIASYYEQVIDYCLRTSWGKLDQDLLLRTGA